MVSGGHARKPMYIAPQAVHFSLQFLKSVVNPTGSSEPSLGSPRAAGGDSDRRSETLEALSWAPHGFLVSVHFFHCALRKLPCQPLDAPWPWEPLELPCEPLAPPLPECLGLRDRPRGSVLGLRVGSSPLP
ncbi:unnamed protein product [Prorocentrum cordatum]|uniref:Uncharacterized protein n=1 Tax=Prorocentrum cordatum TaxID=2364126 RepID=A0ABN9XB54_9DINO|nr:unnamed protein product [Polarella glacialis]